MRASLKLAIFAITLIFYFLFTLPFLPFLMMGSARVRAFLVRTLQVFCRFGIFFMGVKTEVQVLDPKFSEFKNALIVCNHMSYLDVLILYAKMPSCFVTSVEIKHTPFLGQLCLLAGCLFVERRNRDNLSQEVAELTSALKAGISVSIFPEATSSNGEELLRFRNPLFQAAIDAQVPVLVLALNYHSLDGERVNRSNRDQVCWYGDMAFFGHLWNLFKIRETRARITVIEQLETQSRDRGELAQASFDLISQHFNKL